MTVTMRRMDGRAVDLKIAKVLGLTVPTSLLSTADDTNNTKSKARDIPTIPTRVRVA